MTTPANGATVHHTPNDGTKPYTGAVSGDSLVITYIFDGEASTRTYEAAGAVWTRGTWRRVYTAAMPPTTPPSGAYVVSEWTDEPGQWTTRETGAWHA